MRRDSDKAWWSHIAPYVGVVVGIVVLASPVLADFVEGWRAEHTISQTTTHAQGVAPSKKDELFAQAHAYNDQLVSHASADNVWPYDQQLVWDPSGAMCWVDIPKIDIRLCVYHGTGEAELASGAGHVEGTSLPVGGPSTHCALSAHSGMPTSRMFDDIHDLSVGDVFVVWTLEEPFAYRVTKSTTVDPGNTAELDIEEGKDLCTLITCTPYGVNSQRLLVRGERCPYEEASTEQAPYMYVSPRVWPLVAGLVGTGAALAITSWLVLRRRRHGRGER